MSKSFKMNLKYKKKQKKKTNYLLSIYAKVMVTKASSFVASIKMKLALLTIIKKHPVLHK